ILGNPPYNAFAGVSPSEEHGLVEPYKKDLITKWKIKKFNLDDLYIRFFRLAERRIVEKSGQGIICYISNFSYLREPSFVIMRKKFLDGFDKLWIDCMNGDSRETGKITPEGKPDPSVFSTEQNREGIRVGTAICLMVRKYKRNPESNVLFRNFWGVNKRDNLLKSITLEKFDSHYEIVNPDENNRFSFRPSVINQDYLGWPRIINLCRESPIPGSLEARAGAMIDIDANLLENRMRKYYDPNTDWEALKNIVPGLTKDAGCFNANEARIKIIKAESFNISNLRSYALRPFDMRFCYYSSINPLWNRPRPSLWAQYWKGNSFIITRMKSSTREEGAAICYSHLYCEYHFLQPNCVAIPMFLRYKQEGSLLEDDNKDWLIPKNNWESSAILPNLSQKALNYLKNNGIRFNKDNTSIAELIWMHVLAIGYSPSYMSENADGIRQDWPRIPLPDSADQLIASAKCGKKIAALLDVENAVTGVTEGQIREELRSIAVISSKRGQLNPEAGDLALSAGWGHFGKNGIVMPGKGKLIKRAYSNKELQKFEKGSKICGIPEKKILSFFGEKAYDIYFNDNAYWKNMPKNVWEFRIGGYQVIKKWLSYREKEILSRSLTPEEAHYITDMARRIASILIMQDELNENYLLCKKNSYPWNER
ncbi:MAG TPA: type ISP restriction/modification enzyme, partial [Candidatus Nanoarchaeia archaeon]|nr:type ISP restriction/modification enzyme [Candidatus Nanoarchaeia archaeon]